MHQPPGLSSIALLALLLPAISPAAPPTPDVRVVNAASEPVPVSIQSSALTSPSPGYFNANFTITEDCNEGTGEECPFVLRSEPVAVPAGKLLILDFISAQPSQTNGDLEPTLSVRVGGSLIYVGKVTRDGLSSRVSIPSVGSSGSVPDQISVSLSFSASGQRPSPTLFGGASFPRVQQIISGTGRVVDLPPEE